MISRDLATPAVALAVGAHPDDVEFGCGGTLAKWAAGGCRVHHLICTDGAKGSWDAKSDAAALVATREQEQLHASRIVGGQGRVSFLRWPDGELESEVRQRWQVAAVIREVRPNVVLGHDPWRRYRLHPDHRHAGFLVTDGIVAARDPHFFPELREGPHRPQALLLWEAEEPDHVEDVSPFVDVKITALMAHRSQLRSTMDIEAPDDETQVARFRRTVVQRMSEMGGLAGLEAGEAFKLVSDL
ncbi:MAG: PIG-L deacetylase family protein [Acidimicrobiales bacterium]